MFQERLSEFCTETYREKQEIVLTVYTVSMWSREYGAFFHKQKTKLFFVSRKSKFGAKFLNFQVIISKM